MSECCTECECQPSGGLGPRAVASLGHHFFFLTLWSNRTVAHRGMQHLSKLVNEGAKLMKLRCKAVGCRCRVTRGNFGQGKFGTDRG